MLSGDLTASHAVKTERTCSLSATSQPHLAWVWATRPSGDGQHVPQMARAGVPVWVALALMALSWAAAGCFSCFVSSLRDTPNHTAALNTKPHNGTACDARVFRRGEVEGFDLRPPPYEVRQRVDRQRDRGIRLESARPGQAGNSDR